MSDCRCGVLRRAWELPFLAEPEEVAALRRMVRLHLTRWGLPEVVEAAQLCVSELVANVITHVGPHTPTTLRLTMKDTCVRVEIGDPDTRALPTLIAARADAESGRGMALLDAVVDRWGVILRSDSKVTWCELATGLASPTGHTGGPRVDRAEALIGHYGERGVSRRVADTSLTVAAAEEAAIDVIADLLHWLRAHGCDPDEALDRAETRFEAGWTSA
ncbi:ATP-binding protein [Streptomyces longisporoflavus]|uniref:ATP-binding protein n=1 Tax=Streptomyces longisporoflavus TaxID=28044 RepID=UPI00167D58A5|nr:ATP-binding protein [Streptomyces longisporoflavus]